MSATAVVIPVRDRAALLARALDSVRAQTRAPAEVIVVDDGSEDGSGEVARRAGCTVVRLEGAGVSAARNAGLRTAEADRVAFLDSDDEWTPDHLAVTGEEESAVFTSTAAITSLGTLIGSQRSRPLRVRSADRLVWPDNPVVTSGVVVDRRAALEVGGFDERLRHSEDLDLWARLLPRGPGVVLPTVTVRYFLHPGQVSTDAASMRAGADRLLRGGLVRPGTRAAVATRDAWDAARAAGRPRLRDARRFATPRSAASLAMLLAHRAAGRRIAAATVSRSG